MARIRTMKPDFFTHPEVVPVSIPGRLLFLSLLTQADDDGRLYLQPRRIAGLAFGENDRVKVDRLLGELEEAERICIYEADGKPCLHIPKFREHQVINRPSPSRIPPCPMHEGSPNIHGVLSESSQPEVEVEVEQGSGSGKGSEEDQIPPRPAASNGNGKPNPFAIDEHQAGIIGQLLHRYPGWAEGRGSLTYGGIVRLMQEHGARAVNDALEDLLEHAPDVDRPHPYLVGVCRSASPALTRIHEPSNEEGK